MVLLNKKKIKKVVEKGLLDRMRKIPQLVNLLLVKRERKQ